LDEKREWERRTAHSLIEEIERTPFNKKKRHKARASITEVRKKISTDCGEAKKIKILKGVLP